MGQVRRQGLAGAGRQSGAVRGRQGQRKPVTGQAGRGRLMGAGVLPPYPFPPSTHPCPCSPPPHPSIRAPPLHPPLPVLPPSHTPACAPPLHTPLPMLSPSFHSPPDQAELQDCLAAARLKQRQLQMLQQAAVAAPGGSATAAERAQLAQVLAAGGELRTSGPREAEARQVGG